MRRIAFGCTVLGLLCATGVATAAASSPTVSDPPRDVTLVHEFAHRDCDGDHDTLMWKRPISTGGERLTNYHIEQFEGGTNPPHIINFDVGPKVTSVAVTPHVGPVQFSVFAVTASGRSDRATTAVDVDGVPSPQSFDFSEDRDAARWHSVTTSASWFVQTKTPGLGGNPADSTVTITIAPGGQRVSYQAQGPGVAVPVTFRQLEPGVRYTFSALVKNKCGSAKAQSFGFTTGSMPRWFQDTPPLTAVSAQPYRYRFRARGAPAPVYALDSAPAWLTIDPVTGVIHGRPPEGTDSFSYSVSARNSFGLEPRGDNVIFAGTFSVHVT